MVYFFHLAVGFVCLFLLLFVELVARCKLSHLKHTRINAQRKLVAFIKMLMVTRARRIKILVSDCVQQRQLHRCKPEQSFLMNHTLIFAFHRDPSKPLRSFTFTTHKPAQISRN